MEDQQETRPAARRNPPLTALLLIAAGLAAALLITAAIWAVTAKTASPSVPVRAGIPRPNVACTTTDTIDATLFYGYVDGQQREMSTYDALGAQLAGHHVEGAWYCPPRSQWRR